MSEHTHADEIELCMKHGQAEIHVHDDFCSYDTLDRLGKRYGYLLIEGSKYPDKPGGRYTGVLPHILQKVSGGGRT